MMKLSIKRKIYVRSKIPSFCFNSSSFTLHAHNLVQNRIKMMFTTYFFELFLIFSLVTNGFAPSATSLFTNVRNFIPILIEPLIIFIWTPIMNLWNISRVTTFDSYNVMMNLQSWIDCTEIFCKEQGLGPTIFAVQDCRQYCICYNGNNYLRTCDEDYYFRRELEHCDFQDNEEECSQGTRPPHTEGTTTTTEDYTTIDPEVTTK